MNYKIFFLLFFISFVFIILNLIAENEKANLKNRGVTYLMDTKKDTLTVINDTGLKDEAAKFNRLFYNNKDYTEFVKDLYKFAPLAFISSKLLIFSKHKLKNISKLWKCKNGKIFIPKKSELLYIDASNIEYSDEYQVLNGRNMIIKVTNFKGIVTMEDEFEEFSFDFKDYSLVNKIFKY
jgi:hypothetical protein